MRGEALTPVAVRGMMERRVNRMSVGRGPPAWEGRNRTRRADCIRFPAAMVPYAWPTSAHAIAWLRIVGICRHDRVPRHRVRRTHWPRRPRCPDPLWRGRAAGGGAAGDGHSRAGLQSTAWGQGARVQRPGVDSRPSADSERPSWSCRVQLPDRSGPHDSRRPGASSGRAQRAAAPRRRGMPDRDPMSRWSPGDLRNVLAKQRSV